MSTQTTVVTGVWSSLVWYIPMMTDAAHECAVIQRLSEHYRMLSSEENELRTRVNLAIRRQESQRLQRRLVVIGIIAVAILVAGLVIAGRV